MKPLIFTQEHEKQFIEKATSNVTKDTMVGIMVNGKFLTLKSKKNQWRTLGHAKNALRNHFGNSIKPLPNKLAEEFDENQYSPRSNEIWNIFLKHLENKKILRFVYFQNN